MKKIALLSLMTIVFIGDLVSQAPNLMSYQAVIWDASGNLVSEKTVSIKTSILQGSVTGTSVYSETHKVQTNINGLVSLMIGGGTSAAGKISDINWGSGSYFLKTETDPTGSNSYTITGITQLVSVPYSFFSGKTETIKTIKPGIKGQVLTFEKDGNMRWFGDYPTINTNAVTSISQISAISGGNIISNGGLPVVSRGVVWSTSANPTISLTTKTEEGNGNGTFVSSLSNLLPNTVYYIRAYATNSVGTAYGNEWTFKTVLNCPLKPLLSGITRICKGNTTTLKSNVLGGVWSSSNPSIATINSITGNIIGLNKGCARIDYIVKGTNGCLDVISSLDFRIDSIEEPNISKENLIVCVGKDAKISGEFEGWSIKDSTLVGIKEIKLIIDPSPDSSCSISRTIRTLIFTGKKFGTTTITMSNGGYNDCPISFVTRQVTVVSCSVPTLFTTSISNLTTTTANSGGNITSDGGAPITSRGVVWSINPDPKISLHTKTSDGMGIGSFNSKPSNLIPNTTYYVKAYATNIMGTNYGSEIEFRTISENFGIPCEGVTSVKDIDGNLYKTVQIASNCWLSENLRASKYNDGTSIPLHLDSVIDDKKWSSFSSGAMTLEWKNITPYPTPVFYNWFAAVDPRGLCPIGWRIPTDSDWDDLSDYLGGDNIAGTKMQYVKVNWWEKPNLEATNESGFTGLFYGIRAKYGYFRKEDMSNWWTSSEVGYINASYRGLIKSNPTLIKGEIDKKNGLSVRCIMAKPINPTGQKPTLTTTMVSSVTSVSAIARGNIVNNGDADITSRGVVWSTNPNPDISLSTKTFNGSGIGSFVSIINDLSPNTTYYLKAYATNLNGTYYGSEITFKTLSPSFGIPCSGTPTVKDVDGNTYNTVQIGFQCWLKENLSTTKYRDGSIIPIDSSGGVEGDGKNETWSERKIGARTIYGNNTNNLKIYGYLYNWFAAVEPKGLCPIGWSVPSDSDWDELSNFLGGEEEAGGKMKSTVTTLWNSINIGATNKSGFNAIPGGKRYSNTDFSYFGGFRNIGVIGQWWSSDERFGGPDRYWGGGGHYWVRNSNEWLCKDCPDFGSSNKNDGQSVRCIKVPDASEKPKFTTISVTKIGLTSCITVGNISSEVPIKSKGVVWSTNPNPDISLHTKTFNGSGIGNFTSHIYGLMPNTTYYLKLYATNSVETFYGSEIVFKTTNTSIGFPCSGTTTVKDIDGNIYNTIPIGTQCWIKENLRTTKYQDGTNIPIDSSGGESGNQPGEKWSNLISGARTINGNYTDNLTNFGYLYNWYSVENPKGICPVGWHVPSSRDWRILEDFLGEEAGGKLKLQGTTYWRHPNKGASNMVGFSGLPGGYRNSNGEYYRIGDKGKWWSSDEIYSRVFTYGLSYNYNFILFSYCGVSKTEGNSIRCIKN